MLALLVGVLFVSAYSTGYLLYSLSLLALILQVVVWRSAYTIRKYNQLGHEIQRVQLFAKHLGQSFVTHEVSHLSAKATALLYPKASEVSLVTASEQSDESIKANSLLMEVHENAFWNHHTFGTCHRRYRLIAAGMLGFVALSLLLALPLLDKEPADTILRLSFSLFSFAVVYETIDTAISFKRAAEAMLEIDNEAVQLSKDATAEATLALFSKYHYWKSSCGSVPETIYSRMKNGLNHAWGSVAKKLYFAN